MPRKSSKRTISTMISPVGLIKLGSILSVATSEDAFANRSKPILGPKPKPKINNLTMKSNKNQLTERPVDATFVCTGNTCRSQAAQAISKTLIKNIEKKSNKVPIFKSAALASRNPGSRPARLMRELHKEKYNVNTLGEENHYSRQLNCDTIRASKNIYVMEKKQVAITKKLAKQCGDNKVKISTIDSYDVFDPYKCKGTYGVHTCYRGAYKQLNKAIRRTLVRDGMLKQQNLKQFNKKNFKPNKKSRKGRGKKSKRK